MVIHSQRQNMKVRGEKNVDWFTGCRISCPQRPRWHSLPFFLLSLFSVPVVVAQARLVYPKQEQVVLPAEETSGRKFLPYPVVASSLPLQQPPFRSGGSPGRIHVQGHNFLGTICGILHKLADTLPSVTMETHAWPRLAHNPTTAPRVDLPRTQWLWVENLIIA